MKQKRTRPCFHQVKWHLELLFRNSELILMPENISLLFCLTNVVSIVLALKDSPKHKRVNSLISCHRGYRKRSVP